MRTIGRDTAPPPMRSCWTPSGYPRSSETPAEPRQLQEGRLLDLLRWLVNELLAREGEDMISERAKFKEDLLYAT